MRIEIWSDVICPWCYIGKRRFEQALKQCGLDEKADIVWRSFELDPAAQQQYPGTLNELLSRKYGVSLQQAEEMNARVSGIAKDVGLEYRLANARPGNTFDAHRLLHFAASQQKGDLAAEVIMQAYFSASLPVGERSSLARLAPKFGMTEKAVLDMLDSDEYSEAVRTDEARAAELGIQGVPFFVFDGKQGVSGAQPVEVFVDMLQQAR